MTNDCSKTKNKQRSVFLRGRATILEANSPELLSAGDESIVNTDRSSALRASIFRPVQYLGSKLRAVDVITSIAEDLLPAGAAVADLFAGSSVVSQGLARVGFKATAVDTQCYSTLFSRALLGIGRRPGEEVDAVSMLAIARARQNAGHWATWEMREDALIARADGVALRNLDAELPLAWRHGRYVADSDAPLASFYAGGYFGVRQALDLDAIRVAITSNPNFDKGSWCYAAAMTALMHAASMAVHSAGKHFAQPLKARLASADFLAGRLLSDRRVSVPNAFVAACVAIGQAAPMQDQGHRAITGEAEAHLKQGGAPYALHYLDPPYTAQQYSRFYHLLETIAAGALPSLPPGIAPTSGLYPAGRYKSAFSSRRRAPRAFLELLRLIAAQDAAAIVSYSISSNGSDGNARMITLDELLSACRGVFGKNRVEIVDLDHKYRQFNSVSHANLNRDDKEVLVVCRPA